MKQVLCLLGLLLLLIPAVAAQPRVRPDTCAECHAKLEKEELSRPVKLFAEDIHRKSGLGCVHCHVGDDSTWDAKASMDPKKGFIGRPDFKRIGLFCGKCHMDLGYMRKFNPKMRVDQWTEYLTSIHGQKNQAGDPAVATCISCHGTHGIKAVGDPTAPVYPTNVATTCAKCHSDPQYMGKYKIPTDQSAKYMKSVHAYNLLEKRDLSAPTCNDCHGNHGAAPPGISSVAFVCGHCHTRQQKLFNDSPHRVAFEQAGLASCMTCHDNHAVESPSDEMLGTGEQGVCKTCHQPGEKGYIVGEQMLQSIVGMRGKMEAAEGILGRAERAGMEVSKPNFQLNEAREKLIQARVLVHGVSSPPVMSMIGDGLKITQSSWEAGNAALQELDFRRKGLLASLGFILLAALGLYLKIRKMER